MNNLETIIKMNENQSDKRVHKYKKQGIIVRKTQLAYKKLMNIE